MKHTITFLFFFVLVLSARAGISISSVDSTASVCFNSGSISVFPTGGSPPYTYSIINGPSVPNVTYPIVGGNANTFSDLHAGTYTVQITDQSGNTLDVTVTVPGNYQFPQVTYTSHLDTLFAYGSLGRPAYQYAISSVSANGPFGPYQSSDVFVGLCNGTYYLRVLDSCQNFYTIPVTVNAPALSLSAYCQSNGPNSNIITASTYGTGDPPYSYRLVTGGYTSSNTTGIFTVPSQYACPDTVYVTDLCHSNAQVIVDCHPLFANFCSNFSDSTGNVTATGGTPPLTYTFYQRIAGVWVASITQDSGSFAHLPYKNINETVGFGVTDACGRTITPDQMSDWYMLFSYNAPCPFNDSVTVTVTGAFSPGTITCLNCPQPQTQALPTTIPALFIVPDTGSYTLRAIDACGETRDTTIKVPNQPIVGHLSYISCNSVHIIATSGSGTVIDTNVTYTLQRDSSGHWVGVSQNTTGLFYHSPNGNYRVIISTPSCAADTLPFQLPWFNGYCTYPYYDNQCNLKMVVTYGSLTTDFPENYSLTSSGGTVYNEDPQGAGNGIYFNITPGNYTLKSDSGCSILQSFTYSYQLTASHTLSCLNQNSVTLGPKYYYFYWINQISRKAPLYCCKSMEVMKQIC